MKTPDLFSLRPLMSLLALALGGAVMAPISLAQETPAAAPAPSEPTPPPASSSPAPEMKKLRPYRITNTDKLRISVFQEPELNVIARIDSKGCANLPLVGEVLLYGTTIAEAERAVENAYREGRYLRSPQCTINVEEYAVREVSIQGEVRAPGRYPYPVETVLTVLDLVTRAGGFTDTGRGGSVKITRLAPDGTIAKIYVIDVESVIKGKGSNKDDNSLELEPGDLVYVPQRII